MWRSYRKAQASTNTCDEAVEKHSLFSVFHLWSVPWSVPQTVGRWNCSQIESQGLHHTWNPHHLPVSPSFCSTVPCSTMKFYVHISNLSVTADAADRQMPVSFFPQLHHRGHIYVKYSHIKRPAIVSGYTKYKHSALLVLVNTYSHNICFQRRWNICHLCICGVSYNRHLIEFTN